MPDSIAEWQKLFALPRVDGAARDVVLHSWSRSRASGLDPESEEFRLRQVPAVERRARLSESGWLVDLAEPHLEWISEAITPTPHVAYLVDQDGIVLTARGNDREMMQDYGLVPGYDWSESAMGTNGAGTALREGRPVAIFGSDHFLRPLQGFICVAAPIRDPQGRIAGALDLSTSVSDGHPRNLLLIAHAAWAIEQERRKDLATG